MAKVSSILTSVMQISEEVGGNFAQQRQRILPIAGSYCKTLVLYYANMIQTWWFPKAWNVIVKLFLVLWTCGRSRMGSGVV